LEAISQRSRQCGRTIRQNLVRSNSRIAVDLPRASRVTLSLFDVSGRAVRKWDLGVLDCP